MFTYEEIKENLTNQIGELEALQSVYPEELVIADHGILADVNSFIECSREQIPQRLEYTIKLSFDDKMLELCVDLPNSYPCEKPDVYVRSSFLDRTQQFLLNESLAAFTEQQPKNEPCIYALVSWIQDKGEEYLKASKTNHEEHDKSKRRTQEENFRVLGRYWIYSHHIYSKLKRREIVNLMKENCLHGFCLVGKPGIICMEGLMEDCDYCWHKIKLMNWQKIIVKLIERETIEADKDIKQVHKFPDFQEVSFPSSERHNDMGQLLKYLTEHQSQHIFKELFGIEGKLQLTD